MLQQTAHDIGGEVEVVRLCLWCRRKGAEETMDAKGRSNGGEPGMAPPGPDAP